MLHDTVPTVADVMTQVVLTVDPETPIPELVEIFRRRHISGAPVVASNGRVLGVVSSSDLLEANASQEDTAEMDEPREVPRTALEIATRRVVTLDERTPLPEAAKVLLELGIHRVIVTRGGRFAGLLTATDVLKWVARPALALEEE